MSGPDRSGRRPGCRGSRRASAQTTPNFSWIAADDYNDGEGSGNGSAGSLRTQDGWLQSTLADNGYNVISGPYRITVD